MLELTSNHIKQLNDVQLRELVRELCEAELRLHGLSATAVTAGGHQTAPDGGLDVRVQLLAGTQKPPGYVRRPSTGFQVKAEDMPRAKIAKEMAPHGKLRPVIKDLIAAGGAYILVSSRGSVTDGPLQDRIQAMRDALKGVKGASKIELAFYDRRQIASWVSEHPALISWVRRAIGQPLNGWLPYGAWGLPADSGRGTTYLVDDTSRMRDTRAHDEGQISIEAGIRRIREQLRVSGNVVRLVGLSGTGKTRLVAALFEEDVKGGQALDRSLAHYTDMAEQPVPSPRDLAAHLDNSRHRAILIVDNCPTESHSVLALACKGSKYVSLITVEFDVRDDAPEYTDVFLLEPASDGVIGALVRQRFPHVAQPAVSRIVDISSGNARFALAIAGSIKRGETLTGVPSEELFSRLFHQRSPASDELMWAACACALVYSFAVEDAEGQSSELPALAKLADLTDKRLYALVAQLSRRQLVQRRSQWRAVLPQALAAWLAKRALQEWPIDDVLDAVMSSGRLARSFSRRLGDLHDSAKAQEIAQRWLAVGGLLGDPHALSDIGQAMLSNIAPVHLPSTRAVLKRAVEQIEAVPPDSWILKRRLWLSELRSLAYEAEDFPEATNLMMRLCVAEGRDAGDCRPLTELFQIVLSGTLAPLDLRVEVIGAWLEESNDVREAIAIECVRAVLRVSCDASAPFEFGARPRTLGLWPESPDAVSAWFSRAIEFAARLAARPGRLGARVKTVLATNFGELWREPTGAEAALEKAMTAVAADSHWTQGWVAVLNALRRKATGAGEKRQRLAALEVQLRPRNLIETSLAYLRSKRWDALDIAGELDTSGVEAVQAAQERADATARELGEELARDDVAFGALVAELVSNNTHRAREFGEGLARAAPDLRVKWSALVEAFGLAAEDDRNDDVLCGFLTGCGRRDRELQRDILDEAVGHPILAAFLPQLQLYGSDDEGGLQRLLRSLQSGLTPVAAYRNIFRIKGSTELFCRLMQGIAERPGGLPIAVDGLYMRMHGMAASAAGVQEPLKSCARDLLSKVSFEAMPVDLRDHLGRLIHHAFAGDGHREAAKRFAIRLSVAMANREVSPHAMSATLTRLLEAQPEVFLDVFFAPGTTRLRELQVEGVRQQRLLDRASIDVLVRWAHVNPDVRVPRLLDALTAVDLDAPNDVFRWSEAMSRLIVLPKNRLEAFQAIERQLVPFVGTDDHARRVHALLAQLASDQQSEIRQWAGEAIQRLEARVAAERARDQRASTSFE